MYLNSDKKITKKNKLSKELINYRVVKTTEKNILYSYSDKSFIPIETVAKKIYLKNFNFI